MSRLNRLAKTWSGPITAAFDPHLRGGRRDTTVPGFSRGPGARGDGRPSTRPLRILIAGVGNELLSDDGVGVHALRQLQSEPPPGVTLVEIGTAVLHGLSFLETADRVLVIDAARGGQAPGTIYLFEATANHPPAGLTSIHALGLREAASLLLAGSDVPPITVLGVEPQTFDYGMSLSDPVRAALPRIVALARETVAEWRQAATARAVTGPAPMDCILNGNPN